MKKEKPEYLTIDGIHVMKCMDDRILSADGSSCNVSREAAKGRASL